MFHITFDKISTTIKLTPYSKIDVRLSAQVLSSVSKVLLAYSPPDAAETVRFCSFMD